MNDKYYTCEELREYSGVYLWSYREDTDESLVLVLIDETAKKFIPMNCDFVNEILQNELINRLLKSGYKFEKTAQMCEFLGE